MGEISERKEKVRGRGRKGKSKGMEGGKERDFREGREKERG